MDPNDELSLWLADGWLRASDEDLQGLLVEDLWDQAAAGTPLAVSVPAIARSERQPGDFGMEIAATLLAPVLVELLKDFWIGFLKKLAEDLGGKLADASTGAVKTLFLSTLGRKDGEAITDLTNRVHKLAADRKITPKEADQLLNSLRGPRLAEELRQSRLADRR